MAKVIAESIFVSAMSSLPVRFRVIGAQDNAFWKFRFRHRSIHFDQHVVPTADVLIAQIFKQFLRLWQRTIASQAWCKAKLGRLLFERAQSTSFCPMNHPGADA